jgi:WD40 repeat protein
MGRARRIPAPLLLLGLCIAAMPASAADALPAGGPRPLAKLAGPAGTDVAFSRDGKLILTAGGDSARVWDARTFEPRTPPLTHRRAVSSASLSVSGKWAVTTAGAEAVLWEAQGGRRVRTLGHQGKVHDAAIRSDDTMLATACSDGSARLWDVATGRLVAELKHEGAVGTVSFSPDGKRLLTSALDKDARAAPRPEKSPEAGRPSPRQVYVWDVQRQREVSHLLEGRDDCVGRPVFSPDGGRVGVPVGWYGAIICDPGTGNYLAQWRAITGFYGVTMVDFSRDGARFLAAGDDGGEEVDASVRVMTLKPAPNGPLDFKFDTVCRLFPNQSVSVAAIRPGGEMVASVFPEPASVVRNVDVALIVSDVASGRDVLRIPEWERRSSDPHPRRCVAWSPDGRRVAAGFASDGYTAVWEVPEEKGR